MELFGKSSGELGVKGFGFASSLKRQRENLTSVYLLPFPRRS